MDIKFVYCKAITSYIYVMTTHIFEKKHMSIKLHAPYVQRISLNVETFKHRLFACEHIIIFWFENIATFGNVF
jgi:hypothetical protein